ncbi:50S ribosomal protein L18 [Acidihalobacter yilgarnensis]|uniref:Large ribosomal subunit protein uL18 n=1 Tax=Acidihalobacter yilgarnensis TaxID=2819280 RepID=A0A1D8IQB2_9GAMM|nr:50S ribosomal protein L18 [Acidihalobacter yilgarnensis]AOU98690.1 50S ribosomal protein L18 [Acidihalobacter yilgarnensis]
MEKKQSRLRRAKRARSKIKELGVTRLCIHRTPRHIYAQIIAPNGSEVIATASTVETTVRGNEKYTGNIEAAKTVGRLVAERAAEKGIKTVAFDRSGFRYHGRVKALADAARENGLDF